jgi:hypothetical protein
MKIKVKFEREPAEDIDVVTYAKVRGRTMLDKQKNQFRKELDECKEIKGTYALVGGENDGSTFIVEFTFDSACHSGEKENKNLLVRLLQYGYERYGWAGTFEVM